MKTPDYESILCTVFDCSKPDLQLYITLNPSKDRIIEAMEEAVRQGIENYEKEYDVYN